MTRDAKRSTGAILGLAIGWTLMWSFGLGGLVYAFCFGAGAAVVGGMIGERWSVAKEHE